MNAGTSKQFTLNTQKVLLAAGTLATTRLVLKILKIYTPIRLFSNPTAAFMLFLPKFLGYQKKESFGLGQLSFKSEIDVNTQFFGSTFSTTGIPISNFAAHLPMNRRNGIDILVNLLSSCLLGNVFLPGTYSNINAQLIKGDYLSIIGSNDQNQNNIMQKIQKSLRYSFRLSGAILLPASWKIGELGSDAHYASTFPMSKKYSYKKLKKLWVSCLC